MKLHNLLPVATCTFLILVAPIAHAQGLRVPGSASFGNDWRVGAPPGPSSGYGNNDSANSAYGSPSDASASRQYGSPSTYGSGSSGTSSGSSGVGSGSSFGSDGSRPTQTPVPRSPGGGLRAN